MKKLTVPAIKSMKGKNKITALTAYDYFTAKYLDEAGIDVLLVGDSLNMVLYGNPTTLGCTMDTMLTHTECVARAVQRALVVGDMPFMSYQVNDDDAVRNAGKFVLAGASAVKLEGGLDFAATVERIVRAGIPVMGHIGMRPQSILRMGTYKTTGTTEKAERHLIESAKALQDAGCFSIVLEKVKPHVAKEISSAISIPTIGIGAGIDCDGQILVVNDILGLYDEFEPPFVRKYADLKPVIIDAAKRFADDVRNLDYPNPEEK